MSTEPVLPRWHRCPECNHWTHGILEGITRIRFEVCPPCAMEERGGDVTPDNPAYDQLAQDIETARISLSIALGKLRWLKTNFETYAIDPPDPRYNRVEDAEGYVQNAIRELRRVNAR